ncbi:MAG: response regulator [bacterium]|nr:response regulator [bacterium]
MIPDKKKIKILVLDDEPNITNLVSNILELEGYESLKANSVKEALEILDKNWKEIKIMICDYKMPEMDGLEFVKKVRQNPLYNNIDILMLTAVDTYETIKQSTLLGVKDYIIKPFEPQEIIEAIERVLIQKN